MKINEVEALVGITKKNIRFYEAEGLLAPRRNSDNGYRDYGEAEVDALDARSLLERMEQMEQEGTTFMDKQKLDMKRRYAAPVVAAIVMAILMAGLIWLFLWAFETDPAGAPPLPLLALFIAIPGVVILGVVIALVQRLREIGKGDEDAVKKY